MIGLESTLLESTLLESHSTITPWDLYVVGWLGSEYALCCKSDSGTQAENTSRFAASIANALIKLRPKTPEELGL